jgi:hypothetical protein
LSISLILLGVSCRKNGFNGDKTPNLAPKTYMTADTINRTGSNRYNSQVKVQWWGTDADGYVKGYKISTDLVHWIFTTRQDSVFNLLLPNGKDTFDFRFYVKAVDNNNSEDPNYASLTYPVKNAPPEISYIEPTGSAGTITRNPRRSFPVLKYTWNAMDPDGSQDLDHIEMVLNDTTSGAVYQVNAVFSDITLMAENPAAAVTTCKVYNGQSNIPLAGTIQNLKTADWNVLYIRSVDRVGAHSRFVPSDSIFVKRVTSTRLLVNAISSSTQRQPVMSFYISGLNSAGITSFDTLMANEVLNNTYTELSVDNLTQQRIFSLFKHILWFTDDANFSLSFGQKTTAPFFKNGGTMFMSAAFNNNWDTAASWLDFTPVRTLVPQRNGQTYRMVDKANINASLGGWPALQFYTSGAPIIRPFFKFDDNASYEYKYLYNASIRITGGGPSFDWISIDSTNIMAKRATPGGPTNFIFTSIPMEKLTGNASLTPLFTKIFINELDF